MKKFILYQNPKNVSIMVKVYLLQLPSNIMKEHTLEKSPIHLREHKITHHGKMPHECKECSKTFLHPSLLKNHEKIHTWEKHYECNDSESMEEHILGENLMNVSNVGKPSDVSHILEDVMKGSLMTTRELKPLGDWVPARTRFGMALPAHLLHHATMVPLSSGPIAVSSASTATLCQCRITYALHVPCCPWWSAHVISCLQSEWSPPTKSGAYSSGTGLPLQKVSPRGCGK
ncbi:hypothetical protein QTO34_015476 [Cnephaeus nilssonii]|uniref:C2H2-type domain-containing protein n=1 Tax=Cnephaeus nilssonii TaxID=3371016 RepID=A0AA40I556_CNENI|nr:hypothetical protein QTO34_015476 [Eptesicus nilssonii]